MEEFLVYVLCFKNDLQWIQWQDDFKCIVDVIGVVFYLEFVEVGFYDGVVDIQFYVYVVGFCVEEWFEQLFFGVVVYIWALVDYFDQYRVFGVVDQVGVQVQDVGGVQVWVGGYGFCSVFEQIDEYLFDQYWIDVQMWQVVW